MSDCQKLEPVFTAYVDGEAPEADRMAVATHIDRCPSCRSRVDAERAVRRLLQDRRRALSCDVVPSRLRARCHEMRGLAINGRTAQTAAAAAPRPATTRSWRARLVPFAVAASLTVVVGGTFLYEATSRSSRLLAAELTADHVKCFAANRMLGLHHEAVATAQTYLASRFSWCAALPQLAGLELEAARPCLYGEGRAAHVMYRYGGRPVSLFMLPGTARREELVEIMGHEAAIWSADGRTFVLIAQDSPTEVRSLAAAIHQGLQ